MRATVARAQRRVGVVVEITGFVEDGYGEIANAFRANWEFGEEVGAGFSLVHDGKLVVDLTGGTADESGRVYDAETLQLVFSSTKGVAAICDVDVLTASTGRTVGIDTKVLLVDLDLLGDLLEEGRHLHGREGGLALALVVERRDAHKSVHTVLGLHQPIGVAALEHELDVTEAGLGAFGDGENLDVEAPLVGPAVVHPHQYLGPVLRIGAALTGLDLTNGIALVEFTGEQRAHLKLVEHRLE